MVATYPISGMVRDIVGEDGDHLGKVFPYFMEGGRRQSREYIIPTDRLEVEHPITGERVRVAYSLIDLTMVQDGSELLADERIFLDRIVTMANAAYLNRGILDPENSDGHIKPSAYFGKHVLVAWYEDEQTGKQPITAVAFQVSNSAAELPMYSDFEGEIQNFVTRHQAKKNIELGKLAAQPEWQNTLANRLVLSEGTRWFIYALGAVIRRSTESEVMLTAWTTYLPEKGNAWKDPSGWMFATIAVGVALILRNYAKANFIVGLVGLDGISDLNKWSRLFKSGEDNLKRTIVSKVLRTLKSLGLVKDEGATMNYTQQLFSSGTYVDLPTTNLDSIFSLNARTTFAGMYNKWQECLESKTCPQIGGPATIWKLFLEKIE